MQSRVQCTAKLVRGVQIQVKCDPSFRIALIRAVLVNLILRSEQVIQNFSSDMAAAQLDEGKAGFQVMLDEL